MATRGSTVATAMPSQAIAVIASRMPRVVARCAGLKTPGVGDTCCEECQMEGSTGIRPVARGRAARLDRARGRGPLMALASRRFLHVSGPRRKARAARTTHTLQEDRRTRRSSSKKELEDGA